MAYPVVQFVSAPQPVASAVVTDAFNRANNVTSMGNADTGQTWSVTNTGGAASIIGIISNTAYFSTATAAQRSYAILSSGLADCTIQVTMSAAYTSAGLVYRYVDASNNYWMTKTTVTKRVGGVETTALTFSTPFTTGDVIKVVVSGSSHEVFRNGASVGTFTDSALSTATIHGLTSLADVAARFEDFTITSAGGAVVRFDLNDGTVAWPEHDAYSLGEPTVEGDPDGIGVSYGPRTLTFAVRVDGTKATALASMATLARELLRPTNWLLFQLSSTSTPVWFKTYRSQPGALTLDNVWSETSTDSWKINVSLVADAFAYGAKVTQAPVTTVQQPTHATTPPWFTMPALLGDAPTPLEVAVSGTTGKVLNGFRFMLSVHSGLTARVPILYDMGTAGGSLTTYGTDTAEVAVAGTLGGRVARVTFATNNTMTPARASGSLSAPSVPPAGRYRALLRVIRTDQTSTFSVALGHGGTYFPAGTFILGPTTTWDYGIGPAGTFHASWIDLGTHSFPRGVHPDDYQASQSPPQVALYAQRLSGAASLDMDMLMLVPLEMYDTIQTTTLFDQHLIGIEAGTPSKAIYDGWTERMRLIANSGQATPTFHVAEGGYPWAVPGAVNVFMLLLQVNGINPYRQSSSPTTPWDAIDTITYSNTVTVSYTPRYLWLA